MTTWNEYKRIMGKPMMESVELDESLVLASDNLNVVKKTAEKLAKQSPDLTYYVVKHNERYMKGMKYAYYEVYQSVDMHLVRGKAKKVAGYGAKVDMRESVELGEATKWKMGDGKPRGGSHIENIKFWDMTKDKLQYIIKDAGEAMKANPKARKATSGRGNWADQVNDAHTVLGWRKRNGIKESVELDESKYDSDPRIKKMSAEGRRLLAWMANSFGMSGGPVLDANNVQHLTRYAVDGIVKKLKKIEKKLPADKKKEMKIVLDDLNESTNEEISTTTASVGTVTNPLDIAPKKKKRRCELEKFIGSRVFEVSSDEYSRCLQGRNKFERWNKFFETESDSGGSIKKYSHRNPNSPIIIKDEKTGEMMFLRRRLNDQRLKHNSRSRF